jgi:probable F420-dependent oxidoreductase
MKFGVSMFPTDWAIDIAELARAVEGHGFESLWVPEHTHIPVQTESHGPVPGPLPSEYARTLDPFVALSAAAAVTSTLKVGTGVCLVVQRDPIILAKEVASLDYVSGGRFLFGVGAGWNEQEMRNHGTDPRTRWTLFRERIAAMRAIWTSEESEFHGRLVDFGPLRSWPKPAQKPHPPVLIGGSAPGTLKRVVAFGEGWIPTVAPELPFFERMTELARLAGEAGRPPIPVSVTGRMLGGTTLPSEQQIHGYEEAGVDRFIFWLPPVGAETALPRLTQFARLASLPT